MEKCYTRKEVIHGGWRQKETVHRSYTWGKLHTKRSTHRAEFYIKRSYAWKEVTHREELRMGRSTEKG